MSWHPGIFGILGAGEATPGYTQLDYEEFTSDLGGYTSAGVDCYWTTGDGESGGGDEGSEMVYAYKKDSHTEP